MKTKMKPSSPTIISQETIKPSSPTPFHLRTYNLSALDQSTIKVYQPVVLFYRSNANAESDRSLTSDKLKKSLSKSLTQYYPFAGRMPAPTSPYIDCNDHGVVFLEARVDSHIDTFINLKQQDETLYQLFAKDLDSYNSTRNTSLVAVQLNHFACGGIGLAVSLSHVVGDASTLASFLSHWASLARYADDSVKPVFLRSPCTNAVHRKPLALDTDHTNLVSRKFVFHNSKLNDLKNKVVFEACGSVTNPSRFEVLASLLYKTAVKAATIKSGCFKPSYLVFMIDSRDKIVHKLPQATVGNFASVMMVLTEYKGRAKGTSYIQDVMVPNGIDYLESTVFQQVRSRCLTETSLDSTVAEINKQKLKVKRIANAQALAENLGSLRLKLLQDEDLGSVLKRSYWCSSVCGFPFREVDFGWGKPMGTTIPLRQLDRKSFVLMDTPEGDGIEAWVLLEMGEMEVFECDKELLLYCHVKSFQNTFSKSMFISKM